MSFGQYFKFSLHQNDNYKGLRPYNKYNDGFKKVMLVIKATLRHFSLPHSANECNKYKTIISITSSVSDEFGNVINNS